VARQWIARIQRGPRIGAVGALVTLLAFGSAIAADPQSFLEQYARQAKEADSGFSGFSAERGRALYFRTHPVEGAGELSCASCHQADPRKASEAHRDQIPCRACHVVFSGQPESHRPTRREVRALAPVANPDRFTNEWRTEYWFGYNCKLLLQRECTAQEKGDFITWLLSVK
jgi:cytochrome c peroxidase